MEGVANVRRYVSPSGVTILQQQCFNRESESHSAVPHDSEKLQIITHAERMHLLRLSNTIFEQCIASYRKKPPSPLHL